MKPEQIAEYMLNQDEFSKWMGIKLIAVKENYCLIEMPVKKRNAEWIKKPFMAE